MFDEKHDVVYTKEDAMRIAAQAAALALNLENSIQSFTSSSTG